jgi:hypothetical protein
MFVLKELAKWTPIVAILELVLKAFVAGIVSRILIALVDSFAERSDVSHVPRIQIVAR